MRAFLFGCGISVILIAASVFVVRVPSLSFLIVLLNSGVGLLGGFSFCWSANWGDREPSILHLLGGSLIIGVFATTIQYVLVYDSPGILIMAPFFGAVLGTIGALLYQVVERVRRGKEDPQRERRFQRAIEQHKIEQLKIERLPTQKTAPK